MSKAKKVMKWGSLAVLVAVVVGGIASWNSEIAPIEKIDTSTFSPELIAKGEKLASVGDCAVCHTRPGGERMTGGLAMEIPFGTIYSTNITPDRETGIGKWSYDAFERAMRKGVDREGHYLYPAFPYTAFTKTTDEDLKALYAYLMSQPAVKYQPEETSLMFPFNIRQGVVTWNWLFLEQGAMQPDPQQSAQWNRGAYLTEGLGHCSACHSPRNIMYGEKGGADHLAGGEAEGWSAPSLVANGDSPIIWGHKDLVEFMSTGFSANHGVAAGPMAPVIEEGLSQLPPEDIEAIATYLMSFKTNELKAIDTSNTTNLAATMNAMAEAKVEPLSTEGARLFSGACMACHAQEKGAKLYGQRPSLALNTNLHSDSPDNVIRVMLDGIQKPALDSLGYMPAFRHNLSDAQIVSLLAYLRQNYAEKPAWPDLEQRVKALRAETEKQ